LIKSSDAEKFTEEDWVDTIELVLFGIQWISSNIKIESTQPTSEISPAPKKGKKK